MLILFHLVAAPLRVSAANVMNYGADGNDYFQFTTPSMAFDKASGFTTLITFAMHVNADGTLLIGGVACTNGVYVGPTNWGSLINTLNSDSISRAFVRYNSKCEDVTRLRAGFKLYQEVPFTDH